MSTLIRPEVSKRNDFYIEKHRYYELKHFCLQYPEWKRKLLENTYIKGASIVKVDGGSQIEFSDKVFEVSERDLRYKNNMALVERACYEADSEFYLYLLLAVTEGVSYEYLKMIKQMPCGRSKFYKAYRKIFWILDNLRNA